jgi:hypothetical protein
MRAPRATRLESWNLTVSPHAETPSDGAPPRIPALTGYGPVHTPPGLFGFRASETATRGRYSVICHVLASVAVLPLWLPAYGLVDSHSLTHTNPLAAQSSRSPGEAIPYRSQPPAHRVLRDDASNRSRWPFFPSDEWLSEAPFRGGARSLASLGRFGLIAFAGRRQASTKQSWPASQDKTGPAAVSDLGPWRAWNGGDGYVGVGICIGINQ